MITLTKNGNAIVFTFSDNAHYLFDGTIEVPINSLTLITDNSQMATFKKSASNDIFISATYAELGMSKSELESWFKENACGSTGGGGGVTSGEVETMIDQAISGKQDTLIAGSGITISGNVISSEGGNKVVELTQAQYDALVDKDPDTFYIITDASAIDINNYYNKTEVDTSLANKADTSAVTAVANDVSTVSGQVATKVNTTDFNAYSAATDARIAEDEEVTAAALNNLQENKADTSAVTAVNDALTAHTSDTGIHVTQADKTSWNAKAEPYSAGTGIEISGNVISVTGGGGGSYVYYTEDTSSESATIKVQNDDGLGNRSENRVFVDGGDIIIESYNETDDGEGNTGTTDTQVDINSLGLSIITYSDDGIDTTQTELKVQPMGAYINSEPIATEPYVNAAISGKADTSAVTAVANDVSTLSGAVEDAGAYYISFATIATTGIRDEDWDGIVAAIDDHRPIYAGYPRNDGGILYYGVECMNKNVSNTQIILTSSDNSSHYFYTFTKNGSNDYTFTSETRPYTTQAEKDAWNTVSEKVETSAITSAITSASTNAEVAGAKAVYDAIQAGGGGGATYSAGTNISISNDTINCTLPITAVNSNITIKDGSNKISSNNTFSQVFGTGHTIDAYGGYNQHCITVEGINNSCGTQATHVEGGYNRSIAGSYSHVEGAHNILSISTSPYTEVCSHVEGKYNKVLNYSEHASGQYNNSVSVSTTFGDSGNTLFSVGNGTADNARHNALEVRQNGDIYVNDGTNDVRLQDTILALGGLKLVKLTQAEYDQLATKDANTLYIISNVVS